MTNHRHYLIIINPSQINININLLKKVANWRYFNTRACKHEYSILNRNYRAEPASFADHRNFRQDGKEKEEEKGNRWNQRYWKLPVLKQTVN